MIPCKKCGAALVNWFCPKCDLCHCGKPGYLTFFDDALVRDTNGHHIFCKEHIPNLGGSQKEITEDKSFKGEVKKLIVPKADDPNYTGPALYCPHCKKEITVSWLQDDMDTNCDMVVFGEYETDCPHCDSSLEFETDVTMIFNSIKIRLVSVKEACEQCNNKFETFDLKTLNDKKLCSWCYMIRERRNGKEIVNKPAIRHSLTIGEMQDLDFTLGSILVRSDVNEELKKSIKEIRSKIENILEQSKKKNYDIIRLIPRIKSVFDEENEQEVDAGCICDMTKRIKEVE